MTAADLLACDLANHADIVAAHAVEQPDTIAIVDAERRVSWRDFDALVDATAARLQSEGVGPGDNVAICGYNSVAYAAVFIAALRIGAAAAPLTSSASRESLGQMLRDSAASHLFADTSFEIPLPVGITRVDLATLDGWGAGKPTPVTVSPSDPFNIIYSSGTTGTPKGIVQSHAMRWAYLRRIMPLGYAADSVTINATPLYSNTTLVSFLPQLAAGGRCVLMRKFDARGFLELAQAERATHTMLVPVQYRRIMALPDFDSFDLSSFRLKSSTSSPFDPALKGDVLKRWPGGLVDSYGMTEGGASTILIAHLHPEKLHTVGKVAEGSEIRLIDEDGVEVPPGETGEIVERGPMMMTGYRNRAEATAEAMWTSPEGNRYMRQGDVGRFDADGFLILMDRRKDVIISGGFNIYPSDLEAELLAERGVIEAAVVAAPSADWGETPAAFVVLADGTDPQAVLAAANARLGRTQRITSIHTADRLPRSDIGKVLKRELRDRLTA
ncbi:Long-chain-fatty-acid--CoA ligase [Sphingomonas antarctica]|uniref:class I adenylate-forming enzyme family protein n=1 Tax=Sphingomonas antarctica TaxID=2040274 RepID=UPI0039ED2CB4